MTYWKICLSSSYSNLSRLLCLALCVFIHFSLSNLREKKNQVWDGCARNTDNINSQREKIWIKILPRKYHSFILNWIFSFFFKPYGCCCSVLLILNDNLFQLFFGLFLFNNSFVLSIYQSLLLFCTGFFNIIAFFVVVVLSAIMLTMHLVCVCAHRCMTIPLRQFFSFGFFLSIIIMVGWWWRSSAFWWNPFPRSQILLFKLLFRLFVDRNKNKNKKISKSFSFF